MGSLIFDDMTWSYSRLSSFVSCPHKFFLTYLYPSVKQPQFFSSYGSFFHEILDAFYSGAMRKEDLLLYYMQHFRSRVCQQAPTSKIYSTYYRDGISTLMDYHPIPGRVLASEQEVSFSLSGRAFVGIQDLVLEDQGIVLVDHKARALKPRSGRKKATKSDEELDRYLRQLYLYSIPMLHQYGTYPSKLAFNCYRSGSLIVEPFRESVLEDTKKWASDTIQSIVTTESWYPQMDYCRCKYLCDVNHECDYCISEYGDPRRY